MSLYKMESGLLLFILGLELALLEKISASRCRFGWQFKNGMCIDVDECTDPVCGLYTKCFNTNGSYYCQCESGFQVSSKSINFTAFAGTCWDINECLENLDTCGPRTTCQNTIGSHNCICSVGYGFSTGTSGGSVRGACEDEDECERDPLVCGMNGTCTNSPGAYICTCDPGFSNHGTRYAPCSDVDECADNPSICGERGSCHNAEGSYTCVCHPGYTNYGNAQARCTELKCDLYKSTGTPEQTLPGLKDIVSLMRNSCLELTGGPSQLNGEMLLEKLFTTTNYIMSDGPPKSSSEVSALLSFVENAMRLIGPLMKQSQNKMETQYTETELLVWREGTPPEGPVSMSTEWAKLDTHWETAAGNTTYPGFTMAALVSYKGLELVTNHSFPEPREAVKEHSFQINSKVVTACVSNPSTDHLDKPVTFTFSHLQSRDVNHTCVFWDMRSGGGAWSTWGCKLVESNSTHTVCSCSHLSSFAVLMSLYEIKDTFQLRLITWVGLSMSLVCLLLCIVTFRFCRSIQGTRNTIHLHLCICLFIADLIFLAGISQTKNRVGCALVAGLLHYFFLAAFCWMCLEGVQLYRMVVLVFNTTLRTRCWLNLEDGFIWSFFGPVCVIIIINAAFFIITVWRLAQKFSSLNPDMSNLRKIKMFTVTAIAQLFVLGSMWVFGCFQFEQSTLAMSYLFTIHNSLQGALVFLVHCLFSKQVREEYAKFLPCICTERAQKKYSESSSSQASKTLGSGQNTGESLI